MKNYLSPKKRKEEKNKGILDRLICLVGAIPDPPCPGCDWIISWIISSYDDQYN
jgi:hypothetical protein